MRGRQPYLGDPADVLIAVLLREAQVLVQAEAHVVAVEAVGGHAQVQQVLLERRRDRRLARRREPREPDRVAALAAELLALAAAEGRVPGDVAAAGGGQPGVALLCLVRVLAGGPGGVGDVRT